MTLGEILAVTRNLLFSAAPDESLPDDVQLTRHANLAMQRIWQELVRRAPDRLEEKFDLTVPSTGTVVAPLISNEGGGVLPALLPVLLEGGGGTVYVHKILSLEALVGGKYLPIDPVDRPEDRFNYEPSYPYPVTTGPTAYYVQGGSLKLTPPPAGDTTARMWFIRVPLAMLIEADLPWNGVAPEHHYLIALQAAVFAFRRGNRPMTPWDADLVAAMKDLALNVGASQGQVSRRVQPHGYY